MIGKKKSITLFTVLFGVVVPFVAGYAFKDKAVEQWYIWKLESQDEEEWKNAARNLGEMGSVRAVPIILQRLGIEGCEFLDVVDIFGIDRPETPTYTDGAGLLLQVAWKVIGNSSTATIPYLIESFEDGNMCTRLLAVILLRKLGPDAEEAIPAIIKGLRERGNEADWHVEATRYQIVKFLGLFDREAEQAIAPLTAALRDENESIRQAAAKALRKIQGEQPEPSG